MQLYFFCPRWGSEAFDWDEFLTKVRRAGYEGVEWAISSTISKRELDTIWDKIQRYGLLLIGQHYDTYESDYSRHSEAYHAWFEKVKPYPFLRINSQTGKDYFTEDQNRSLINLVAKFSEQCGIPVFHETHRNKFSFAAHITRQYLEAIKDLRITLDASHWVNVAESWLEDQQEALDLAILRTSHIHARVGYPEGPQVPDPLAPEWESALEAHLNWWGRVVKCRINENNPLLTITPEFGPYPYLIEFPVTRQPLADQWDINVWMMRFMRERYMKLLQ